MTTKHLTITKGDTFSAVRRWDDGTFTYKAITAITKAAPARITATSHAVPDGWPVAIVSVLGMTEINAENSPPSDPDYHDATAVDANTIDLNDVNSAGFSTYTSGGYVQYKTPEDLSGYTARMSIKDAVGGTEILSLTTENSRIVLDNTAKTITVTLSATVTAALTARRGVYDLEMVSSGGTVTKVWSGNVTITDEVTT